MLIVCGGLPGTGKTTLAKAAARKCAAVYLRIDTIEQSIRDSHVLREDVEEAGYITAYRVAADNLRLGLTVIADAVNALGIARDAWADVARDAGVAFVGVEIVCSDLAEHRKRVEARRPDIATLRAPTWQDVVDRIYEPWTAPHIVLDTAHRTVEEAETELMGRLRAAGLSGGIRN